MGKNKKLKLRRRYIIIKHMLIGIGVFYFLIHPLTMVIYWFEFSNVDFSYHVFFKIVPERILDSFSFQMAEMSVAFVVLGGVVGFGSGMYSRKILQKNKILAKQDAQLEKNIAAIIDTGENEKVEFKSSLRYDLNKDRINKGLEEVVVKTVAGFFNAEGGALLIGVDDAGNIIGLQKDYTTLKKKNRDGFELRVMQLISTCIGTEFCSLVNITFYKVNTKEICSIDVEPAPSPAYVNLNRKTLFYLRTGNSTQPLTVQEAVNYIKFKGFIDDLHSINNEVQEAVDFIKVKKGR